MKNNEQSNFNLKKFSIILSSAAIIICIICAVYAKFVKNEGIMIWVLFGLANLIFLFINLSNYNKEQ